MNTTQLEFQVDFWKDDDVFVGRLVHEPGVLSQGVTKAELFMNLQDAYEELLAARSEQQSGDSGEAPHQV